MTSLNAALSFFVSDTLKIGLLLLLINFVMAVSRYYFPLEKTRDFLTRHRWFGLNYLMAALLGVITPFCSCSSIPLFIGFLSAGIPLGVTFAFLIASPLVNESSLFLFPALFGFKVSLVYNLVGIVIAIVGGFIIEQLHFDKYVNSEFFKFKSQSPNLNSSHPPLSSLIKLWGSEALAISKAIFPYVMVGIAVGALIHGYVPSALIEKYLSTNQWWSVPLAALLGVPLYANSVSVIPIIQALIGKGIPLGTALAFMTATVTLSIPEALILKKVMKWQLLSAFFGITILGIIFIGYLFNALF